MKKTLSTNLSIKNITPESFTVTGKLVEFGVVDLEGDVFDSDTDFGFQPGEILKTPIYYDHGFDSTVGLKQVGVGEIGFDEKSIWIEAQLQLRESYEKDILKLAQAGKLGWSSGTATHLTKSIFENGVKKWVKWPLGLDASVTPIPASLNNSVILVKNLKGKITMTDETTEQTEATEQTATNPMDELRVQFEGKFESINNTLQTLLKRFEDIPIKSKRTAQHSETGGNSDKEIKSFGDFVLAIKRRDYTRINNVYNSVKDVTIETGSTGGYAVPHEYATEILQLAEKQSPILGKITKVPVSGYSGEYPALDMSVTPTAGTGDTAFAAGVEDTVRNPGGAFTETTPQFTNLEWRVYETGGYTEVQKEFTQDSPLAIQALLKSLFSVSISAKNERNLLRGSGVGQPLGILNSAVALPITTVTNNVFAYADGLNMIAKFWSVNPMSCCWIFHPSLWPDLGVMESTSGGPGAFQTNLSAAFGKTFLGYEMAQSQFSPQANNAGDMILADLSMYLMFVRQELAIDFSEHVGFLSGKDTWRFYQRNDGKPWLKSPITLGDPQGSYQVSPFVYHND